jgi:hypothetical protein
MTATADPVTTKKHLHIEDFPCDVRQRMKAAAALAGVTMREWALKGLTAAVEKAEKSRKR